MVNLIMICYNVHKLTKAPLAPLLCGLNTPEEHLATQPKCLDQFYDGRFGAL